MKDNKIYLNYALVSQIFSSNFLLDKGRVAENLQKECLFLLYFPLVCHVCSVLDIDTEKRCSILFFCLKMSIEFDTSLLFAFFILKSGYGTFLEAHNIDIFGAGIF